METNIEKYLKRKDSLPVCIGMERSGSTVAWQVASLALGARPKKTHDYVSGKEDVIYTFRNPIECYISLAGKFSDVYTAGLAKDHALTRLHTHVETFKSLISDSKSGRSVLMMRYEDYYYNPEKRLLDILNFLKINVTREEAARILYETSIGRNLDLSRNMNFGDIDEMSQLHGGHINPKTFGEPLRSVSLYSDLHEIKNDPKLLELCKTFGYKF